MEAPEDEDEDIEDVETEDEIVARALAEADLEAKSQPMGASRSSPPDLNDTPSPPHQMHAGNDEDDTFSFPTLPTQLPSAEEPDDQAYAMISRLQGLSGPSHVPGTALPPPPKAIGKGWNLPGYDDARDDDLDSWCCESPLLLMSLE